MKHPECPVCGDSLNDRWCKGRKLCQDCCNCDWVGVERTPEQQAIKTTRNVRISHNGGYTFEVFDLYGHVLMSSRSYRTSEEAEAALRREVAVGEMSEYGPYTGVLWAATVEAKGTVI